MPIYEYRCTKGHTFETLQRMSEDALDTCEVCAAPATRVLHAPAVHFKGSGFYNTDYGTKKRAREKSAESKSASEGKSTDTKSGDAKSGGSDSGSSSSGSTSDGGKKKAESKAA
ncbi:MAG TPA: zinc ribbon domain-containing protein [Conexibacter sp.]|nr:zinc ribbon domain-containing protein [Conexibacter sp.]